MKIETCHNSQFKIIAESEPEAVFLQNFIEESPQNFRDMITISEDEDNSSYTEDKLEKNELPTTLVWGIELNWIK